MKKSELLALLILFVFSGAAFGQNPDNKFKMVGENAQSILINETFTETVEIFPFGQIGKPMYGLDASADIKLNSENSLVRLLLLDDNFNEYLIYESYDLLLEGQSAFSIKEMCEETSILDGVTPYSIQLEIENAELKLKSLNYSTGIDSGLDVDQVKKQKKKDQNEVKIKKINNNLKKQGKHWIAGATSVSELSYGQRKKLYGEGTFPAGFEYYAGGVISAGSTASTSTEGTLKSATTISTSPFVDEWDWRDRHGKNWITADIKDQLSCGSCWAFSSTGATEAMINVFFNQQLNIDLSEQDILSCSGAGDCSGGLAGYALDYIASTGIVDEGAFPYTASDQPCTNKSQSPSEQFQIAGDIYLGSSNYPKEEDVLKKMLIEMGPMNGGLYSWRHTMVLVGYKVIKEGDYLYYADPSNSQNFITVSAGDPLIGKTVWLFKNQWGKYFGDWGYVYVETSMTNFEWTHGIMTPITSNVNNYEVVYEDRDGDGYYWWGIGEKPANCPGPDLADGDDSDPTKGPLDEYGYCMPLGETATPVANFSASKTSVNTDQSVTFTDLSTNTPTSWSWSFEGGNPATSTLQNPTITYNTAGTFKVTLTATNASGSDTKTVYNYIEVTEPVVIPVADFSANKTTINTSESVTFSDLSSDATTWSWIFEGGSPATSTAQNPVATYYAAGTYKVTLTATNADGYDTKIVDNYIGVTEPVTVILPVADFTTNTTIITEGESVSFSDLSENEPSSWSWTFEGGTPGTSTQQNPSVTYPTAGTYNVTLATSNAAGSDTKTAVGYIQVEEYVPSYCVPAVTVNIEWIAGVKINGQSKTSGANGYNDFTVFGFDLESGTDQTITLSPGFSSRSKFEYWAVWIDYDQDMIFSDSEKILSSSKSKSEITASLNIPARLNITTRMRVAMGPTAPSACNDLTGEIEDYTVRIFEPAPVADFTVSSTNVTVGEPVQFTNTSLYNPTSTFWNFDSNYTSASSSSSENPVVSYNSPGDYVVTLTASNDLGSSQKSMTITVSDQNDNSSVSYCTPANISSTQNYITNFILDGTEVQSGGDGYSLSAITISDVVPGKNYFVELSPLTSSTRNFWRVWIDFNQDGDFDDADETIFQLNNKKGTVSDVVFIPSYASGTTHMRVAMKIGSAPSPCEDGFDGEVEDYIIAFTPPIASAANPASDSSLKRNISVYPNPAINFIKINLDEVGFEDSYSIYDLNGKKLIEQQLTSSFIEVDLSNYPSGIYMVKVVNFNVPTIKKIIKK
ncbi:MAG TPA: PKD domain-containing protein [Draconibacterium sp.]|nr:PKD domain-containing protein [Draconibacterium sp.]